MSRLNYVAANPKPIERQKVDVCLRVFCDETCNALKLHPQMKNENVDGTVLWLSKFIKFWKICNVKNQFESTWLQDSRREAITSVDDPKLMFLLEIANMARELRGNFNILFAKII